MFTLGDHKIVFKYTRDSNNRPIATSCIILEQDRIIARDQAYCNPVDQFSREIGRKLSMARALRVFPRDERKRFWDAYFQRRKRRYDLTRQRDYNR